jgi:hypothetical protein
MLCCVWCFRDAAGHGLDGSASYRLTIPAQFPSRRRWSVAVYDRSARKLLRDVVRATRSSECADIVENSDGSVDVEFGPRPPTDEMCNWIPTIPGEAFGVCVKFDEPPLSRAPMRRWLPDITRVA